MEEAEENGKKEEQEDSGGCKVKITKGCLLKLAKEHFQFCKTGVHHLNCT